MARFRKSQSDLASIILSLLLWAVILYLVWRIFKSACNLTTRENFALSDNKFKLTYVYSPDCTFCKQFDADWNKFNDQLKQAGLPNVTTEKTTDAKSNNVNAFPTVLLYVNNNKKAKADLKGKQTPEALWNFLRTNMK